MNVDPDKLDELLRQAREELITEIDDFLRATGLKPTLFGSRAVNDPGFIAALRKGRQVSPATIRRVRAWMAKRRDKSFGQRFRISYTLAGETDERTLTRVEMRKFLSKLREAGYLKKLKDGDRLTITVEA